jgi:glycosyltransferase involved in cell wall biosynthesis
MAADRLTISHVQPLSLDLYGHDEREWGHGVRYFLPNMAIAQAGQGDRPVVHMLTSRRRRHELDVEGVHVVFHPCVQPPRRLSVERRFARQVSPSMLRAIGEGRPDVVHFHGARSIHGMYAFTAAAAGRRRLPLVAQDHGHRPVGRLEMAMLRFALARTAEVMPANEEGVEFFAGLGVPRERLTIMPNGIEPSLFHANGRARTPNSTFEVLVVSRLWADKDPLTMAEAVAEFARRERGIRVTIVSRGPLRDEVERRLVEAGVPTTIVDEVPHHDLPTLYRRADALVLTSLREGSNQAVVEAMACGLPVVASDIPGIRESLRGVGFLVEPQRPDLVADALQTLATNTEAWRHAQSAGIERASELTWSAVLERLRQVYRRAQASG